MRSPWQIQALKTLDQFIVYAIVNINDANLDSRNTYISDNAAIREESRNYINYTVTQDEIGDSKFVFSALLPLLNPKPLLDKKSIFEKVVSYSPFDPEISLSISSDGYGWPIFYIPPWAKNLEQLLAYAARIGSQISRYAKMTKLPKQEWDLIRPKYWADMQFQIQDTLFGGQIMITGSLYINTQKYLEGRSYIDCLDPWEGHASNINCNFPDLNLLWKLSSVDPLKDLSEIQDSIPSEGVSISGDTSAGALIDSYYGKYFLDEALPDWYLAALQYNNDRSDERANDSADIGNQTPKLIESISICKEQDPSIQSYGNQIADKIKT